MSRHKRPPEPDEPGYVSVVRVADLPFPPGPSTVGHCHGPCKQAVHISPVTQAFVNERPLLRILCSHCTVARMEDAHASGREVVVDLVPGAAEAVFGYLARRRAAGSN